MTDSEVAFATGRRQARACLNEGTNQSFRSTYSGKRQLCESLVQTAYVSVASLKNILKSRILGQVPSQKGSRRLHTSKKWWQTKPTRILKGTGDPSIVTNGSLHTHVCMCKQSVGVVLHPRMHLEGDVDATEQGRRTVKLSFTSEPYNNQIIYS